jgi:hypothetical protein
MALLTKAEARAAAQRKYGTYLNESAVRKTASSQPLSATFDIFLSHASEDEVLIAGVQALLEEQGLKVYVDWIYDEELDRSRVTAATADRLRTRMKSSSFLLYASSRSSPTSKWMPWELGFFDGHRPSHIGVLPLVDSRYDGFQGQEYLGLYPQVEVIDFAIGGRRFGRRTSPGTARDLKTMAA